MEKQIKVKTRVSTEVWHCDIAKSYESARWSYSIFGKNGEILVFSQLFWKGRDKMGRDLGYIW